MGIKEATGYAADQWIAGLVQAAVFLVIFFVLRSCFGGGSKDTAELAARQPVEIVRNSGIDGSVLQVKRFIQGAAKDPSSLEFIEWSPVRKNPDGTFLVRVKYRAKNSFGAYDVENMIFSLSATGVVIAHSPAN